MFLKQTNKNCSIPIQIDILCGIDEIIGGDVVDSQSSVQQLMEGDVRFCINALYSLETNMGSMNNVKKLLANNNKVDKSVVHGLAEGKIKYYDHLLREYDLVKKETSINLINSVNKKLVKSKVNVLTSIEGIHGLFNKAREYAGDIREDFFTRLVSLIDKTFPAYITISHMTQNHVFSFCNGVKMTKKEQKQWFFPYNRGFEGLDARAKRILQICNDRKVSIDLKHTSFSNRLAIYDHLVKEGMQSPIVSHGGIAYMTFTDYLVNNKVSMSSISFSPDPNRDDEPMQKTIEICLNRNAGPSRLLANPSQINLFDEDIFMLLKLKGIIGLILDQRILGATFLKNATKTQLDYLSPEDGNFILHNYNEIRNRLNIPVPDLDPSQLGAMNDVPESGLLEDLGESVRSAKRHFIYFMQSIIYILDFGYKNQLAEPWKYICLGSDFDGMINAINICKTASKYPVLGDKLLEYFNKRKNKLSCLKKVQQDGLNMEELTKRILFKNAIDFFEDRMDLDVCELV
jgi:microsomal dipeptidase-like Zn-dependent dipeptidase